MTKVCDKDGNEIGRFDGRFVYDKTGERRYWISDSEVFSLAATHGEADQATRAAVKIAALQNGCAIDETGEAIFVL